MEPLVRASLAVRTLVRRGHGSLIACGLAAYVVYGGAAGAMRTSQRIALGVWALLLVSRVSRKLRATQDVRLLVDIELGVLLSVGLEAALVRFDGGLSGPYAPAIYVLVAL